MILTINEEDKTFIVTSYVAWNRKRIHGSGSGYMEAESFGNVESSLKKNRKQIRYESVYI